MPASMIGEDLKVDGNITATEGTVNIKGRVTGDISAKAVDVATGGEVEGAVTADTVNIQGRTSGSLKCIELSLGATSEVHAQVTAQRMSSEKGAKLVGEVRITGG